MDKFQKLLMGLAIFGTALLSAAMLLPALDITGLFLLYLVIAFLTVPTYIFKTVFKLDCFYIITLVKTKRFIGFIGKISKCRLWDILADLGLVIGFGAIAVDCLYGRRFSKGKRILVALASSAILFALFLGFFIGFFVSPEAEVFPVLILFSASFAIGGIMLFALVSLAWQAFDIFSKILIGKTPCPGVVPIIPGVQMPNVPSFFTPPLSVWGAFLIILVVHEFSHGALMKRCKLKIKSVGIALFGLLPIGAFVEPDENELKRLPERQQLRVYAIGPASNIYSMAVFIALIALASYAFAPMLNESIESMERAIELDSVVISNVLEDYDLCGNTIEVPAQGVIEKGWILKSYNGIELKTLHDLRVAFSMPGRNVSMVFLTSDGLVEKTLERNSRGEIGIQSELVYAEGKGPSQEYRGTVFWLSNVGTFLYWLLLLSLAVAMINFVPMDPFDGGKIAKIIFLPYFGFLGMGKQDTEKFIGRLFLWIVAGLLFLNALPLVL
ncbi:MAG: site-2 protease family protein [Candidatus Diapherotrites archaeon]|uniref:Site-2 protease family protein n=1 Tax=Candidatus Iainarchaeum sp. TaxID=3101447 RepID=A0A938YP88_9ARCH|nr:site-2 protease family protein [Candidatus Diapherotrites archaeon]